MNQEPELIEAAQALYELIREWRESGTIPSLTSLAIAHEQFGKASEGCECWLEAIRDKVNEEIMAWNEEK